MAYIKVFFSFKTTFTHNTETCVFPMSYSLFFILVSYFKQNGLLAFIFLFWAACVGIYWSDLVDWLFSFTLSGLHHWFSGLGFMAISLYVTASAHVYRSDLSHSKLVVFCSLYQLVKFRLCFIRFKTCLIRYARYSRKLFRLIEISSIVEIEHASWFVHWQSRIPKFDEHK